MSGLLVGYSHESQGQKDVIQPRFLQIDSAKLSGPVLRDTARLSQRYPPFARYGVFGVSTWPIGCDTPPPPF